MQVSSKLNAPGTLSQKKGPLQQQDKGVGPTATLVNKTTAGNQIPIPGPFSP
jgi:hypothetical protein